MKQIVWSGGALPFATRWAQPSPIHVLPHGLVGARPFWQRPASRPGKGGPDES